MNYKPLVSILIPVFNRDNMIVEALESSIRQTYENIEIIVVDNCSTDNTYNVVLDYSRKDERIKLYKNESNIGMIANWKKCLNYSSGEYIHLLCSDDILNKNFVEMCVELLENDKEADFVYTDLFFFNEEIKIHDESSIPKVVKINKNEYVKEMFSDKNYNCQVGHLFRRKNFVIEEFIENSAGYTEFIAGVDSLIPLNALNSHCYYIDKKLYYSRIHPGAITTYSNSVLLNNQYTISWLYYLRKKSIIDESLYSLIFSRMLRCQFENLKMNIEKIFSLNSSESTIFNKVYYQKFYLNPKSIIDKIFHNSKGKRIGVYGIGKHTVNLINTYKNIYGDLDFSIFFIDTYCDKNSKEFMNHRVYSYEEIHNLKLDRIIISSFMYQNEIFDKLEKLSLNNTEIVKIYADDDVRIF